jgi:transcriptional regulator with XRE-family HTH domain
VNVNKRKSFGFLLKHERSKAGLSQAEVAQKADVSIAIVNDVENATRVAGVQTLHKISKALGLPEHRSIEFLLQGLALSKRDYALPGFEDYDPIFFNIVPYFLKSNGITPLEIESTSLLQSYGSEIPSGIEVTLSTDQKIKIYLQLEE